MSRPVQVSKENLKSVIERVTKKGVSVAATYIGNNKYEVRAATEEEIEQAEQTAELGDELESKEETACGDQFANETVADGEELEDGEVVSEDIKPVLLEGNEQVQAAVKALNSVRVNASVIALGNNHFAVQGETMPEMDLPSAKEEEVQSEEQQEAAEELADAILEDQEANAEEIPEGQETVSENEEEVQSEDQPEDMDISKAVAFVEAFKRKGVKASFKPSKVTADTYNVEVDQDADPAKVEEVVQEMKELEEAISGEETEEK